MCMDETWVNQNHSTEYMWLPNDGSDAPKIPSGKGRRLIVLHAGTRSKALIDGCDLVFLAKSKDGDYHQGTYKVRNEIETKRNETKSTKTKRNETKSTK